MAELQLVMLYEPVQCIGFRLFQFLQGVEVPEKYSPSESMTPSMSIQVQNLQHSIRDAWSVFTTKPRTVDSAHR